MPQNKRRRSTAVLSVVLVLCILIGGTLAYLFNRTEEKENVFTFSSNISADLDEPNWDKDTAENLYPGKEVAKDPQITNTSVQAIDEYAAIRISYVRGDGTALTAAETAKLMTLITLDWSTSWKIDAGSTGTSPKQIYIYKEVLQPGVTSDPIFYSITINGTISNDDLLWLAGDYGHTNDCYEYGACDCTVTYRHHERCAIKGVAGNEAIAKGGTIGGKTCDCTPSIVHEPTCTSLVGKIKANCGHTAIISGLGNFNIIVEGAVVQADAFASITEATPELVSLFT